MEVRARCQRDGNDGQCRARGWPTGPTRAVHQVLCIDDDPLVLHFYRSVLEPREYRTLVVADGLAGLALAQRERPDVILLDVMMRGLGRFGICRKLRAQPALRDLPIILLTVWDHPSVEPTGRAAGATRMLRKPADAETIVTAIAQVLGQPKAPAAQEGRPPGPPLANGTEGA